MKKTQLDENVKQLSIKHIQMIALWMCVLIISFPIYSANALAVVTFDEVRVTGGDGIGDFRKDIDTTTVSVKVHSPTRVLATYLEIMNDTAGKDRSTAVKFQQCTASNPYECSVTLPASDVSDKDKYNICINIANVEGRDDFPQTCRDARPIAQSDGSTFSTFNTLVIDRQGPRVTALTKTKTAVSEEPVQVSVRVQDASGTSAAGCVGVKTIQLLQVSTTGEGTVTDSPLDQLTVDQEPATEGACMVEHEFSIETAGLPNGEATTVCIVADDHFANPTSFRNENNAVVVSNNNCFNITKDNRPPEIQHFGVNNTLSNTEPSHVPARVMDVTVGAQILTHTHTLGEVKANVASFNQGQEEAILTCTDKTQEILGEEAGNDHVFFCKATTKLDPSGEQTRSLSLTVTDEAGNENQAQTSISFELDDLSPNVLAVTTPAVFNGIPILGPGQKVVVAQIGETGAGVTGDTISINGQKTDCGEAAVEQGVFHCALDGVTPQQGQNKVTIKVTGHDLADNALTPFDQEIDVDATPPIVLKAQLISQSGTPTLVSGGTTILRLLVRENFAMTNADGSTKARAQFNFDAARSDGEFFPALGCQPFTGPAPTTPVPTDAAAQLAAANAQLQAAGGLASGNQPANPPAGAAEPAAGAAAQPPMAEPAADAAPTPDTLPGTGVASDTPPARRAFQQATIQIKDFEFSPPDVTIVQGGRVSWTSGTATPHTVVDDNQRFESPELVPGQVFSQDYNQIGTFPYHCGIHPGMTGTVTVVAPEDNAITGNSITGNLAAVTGRAAHEDTKDLWQCDWEVTNVKKPPQLQASFTGTTDLAGNQLVNDQGQAQQVTIKNFYMVYTDQLGNTHEIHPDDWQGGVAQEGLTAGEYEVNAIMTSPIVDAKGLEVRSLPVFFELDIMSQNEEQTAASVDVVSCSGPDFEGGLFEQDKTKIMFSKRNPTTAHLRFGLRPGKVPETINKLTFQCELAIISQRGNQISAPTRATVDLTIPLGNVQSITDSNWDTIIEVMEDGIYMAEWVGTANKVLNVLQGICTVIQALLGVETALASVHAAVSAIAKVWPPLQPAAEGLGYAGDALKGVTNVFRGGIAEAACNFLSCTWTPVGAIMEKVGIKDDAMGEMFKDLQEKSSFADPQNKNPITFQAFANPKSSLYMSYLSLCLPGIISNWQRLRLVKCQYIDCLYSQVGAGMPKTTCDKVYHYEICKIEVGEIFYLIPFAHVHKQLASTLKSLLESPVTMIMLTTHIACSYATSETGKVVCNVIYIPFRIMQVVNQVKLIIDTIKGMFDLPSDLCADVYTKIKDDPRYDAAVERRDTQGSVDQIVAARDQAVADAATTRRAPQVGQQVEEVDVFN